MSCLPRHLGKAPLSRVFQRGGRTGWYLALSVYKSIRIKRSFFIYLNAIQSLTLPNCLYLVSFNTNHVRPENNPPIMKADLAAL